MRKRPLLILVACLFVAGAAGGAGGGAKSGDLPGAALPPPAGETLQALVDRTPAGGVLTLENRTYDGNAVIAKPIAVRGSGRTVVRGDGTGNVITITASRVRLEGLTVMGSGLDRNTGEEYAAIKVMGNNNVIHGVTVRDAFHGIYLSKAHDNRIEGVTVIGRGEGEIGGQGNGIQVYYSHRNRLLHNKIEGTRDGIYFEYADHNEVINNEVRRARYGIHSMYSDDNRLMGNRLLLNTGGAAIMHARRTVLAGNQISLHEGTRGFGLLLLACDDGAVFNNLFVHNQRALYLDQSNRNYIVGNRFLLNRVGVELWASSTGQVFVVNRFFRNPVPVLAVGGQADNRFGHSGVGNDWGPDVPLLDLDQNGIGDAPVRHTSSWHRWVEKSELTYLFLRSPARPLLETVNALFTGDDVMAEDPFPVIEREPSRTGKWPAWLVLGMLAGGWLVRRRRRTTG